MLFSWFYFSLSFFFFLCIADMCLQPKIGIMPFSMNMLFFFFSPFPSLYYVHSLKKKKKSIFCNFEFDEIKWFLSDFLSFFFFSIFIPTLLMLGFLRAWASCKGCPQAGLGVMVLSSLSTTFIYNHRQTNTLSFFFSGIYLFLV